MTEQFTDIEVKYVYTRRFTWHNTLDREIFGGFPMKGRVYRDLFNPKTQNHKLKMPGVVINEEGLPMNGLAIKSLQEQGPDYDCDFVEISLDTILDLDILEEDLDSMNQWMETNNTDLQQLYETPSNEPLKKLKQALHNHNQDEAEALAVGTEALLNLWNANSLKFDIVVNLINYLTDADLNSYEDVGNHVRHHPINGKGVNIVQALRALDNYIGDNRRTNEDLVDLYVAVEAIVTEIERKVGNDLID